MKILLALVVVAPVVLLAVGSIRGRVRLRSCCAVPVSSDVRMASAYAADRRD